MRLYGINHESLVDGPGIRVVVFAQGCEKECLYCHNQESWPLDGGKEYSVREVIRLIKKRSPKDKKIKGITFSGGEPFLQAGELVQVALEAKRIGWDVVTFTGYTYEELLNNPAPDIQAMLNATDILIDGPYIHELRDRDLKFRGSTNQRLIDVPASKKRGKVVLFYVT